jgi:glyoxylase-like metal-dependent hydrolase (beta-lactamase superfamily II)
VKLYFHYGFNSSSNCYIAAEDASDAANDGRKQKAVIIDPTEVDEFIINLFEQKNFKLAAVLITHEHERFLRSLHTLQRIYDNFEIFGAASSIPDCSSTTVMDGDVIHAGPFVVEVLFVPGRAADSVVYRLDRLLFTGDTVMAGLAGSAMSSFGAIRQAVAIQDKIFSLRGNFIVLPGSGPPSTLQAEKQFNVAVRRYSSQKPKRAKRYSLVVDMMDSV